MTTRPIPDLYAILGVPATASDDELDRAFRRLVRRLHPDTRTSSGPDAAADQRLQEILAAYDCLRDPVRRAAYNRTRPATTPRPHVRVTPRAPLRIKPALRVGPVRWQPLQSRPRNRAE
ncbi:J domain-containing protein [Kribbella voronezhensis]|uniref:J domain-containing protein n=1 Tax=Kribbella voronezhensis TaxID=2512212 RepID=UPI0010628924|nr:J domain-containing protein [Kribbella voronezhensis]